MRCAHISRTSPHPLCYPKLTQINLRFPKSGTGGEQGVNFRSNVGYESHCWNHPPRESNYRETFLN